MNEHLLGVKINDKKAHLLKITEEVNTASGELSKVLSQVADAKSELEAANKVLASVTAQVADANARYKEINRSCEQRDVTSNEVMEAALKSQNESTEIRVKANEEASQIVAAAQGQVALLGNQLDELHGFIVTAHDQAAMAVSDLGSLAQQKEDITAQLQDARSDLDLTLQTHATAKDLSVRELQALESNIAEAQQHLSQVRADTSETFANLARREKAVTTREDDTLILQSRLTDRLREISN